MGACSTFRDASRSRLLSSAANGINGAGSGYHALLGPVSPPRRKSPLAKTFFTWQYTHACDHTSRQALFPFYQCLVEGSVTTLAGQVKRLKDIWCQYHKPTAKLKQDTPSSIYRLLATKSCPEVGRHSHTENLYEVYGGYCRSSKDAMRFSWRRCTWKTGQRGHKRSFQSFSMSNMQQVVSAYRLSRFSQSHSAGWPSQGRQRTWTTLDIFLMNWAVGANCCMKQSGAGGDTSYGGWHDCLRCLLHRYSCRALPSVLLQRQLHWFGHLSRRAPQ